MPQDQTTGAAGNTFGKGTAPLIARAIGAKMLGSRSNEATYQGTRVVIKCAAPATTSVGVTYKMLEHLDSVLGAFQKENGDFEVLSLPATIYRTAMKPTRSQGPSAGKVGIVTRAVFQKDGRRVQSVSL